MDAKITFMNEKTVVAAFLFHVFLLNGLSLIAPIIIIAKSQNVAKLGKVVMSQVISASISMLNIPFTGMGIKNKFYPEASTAKIRSFLSWLKGKSDIYIIF